MKKFKKIFLCYLVLFGTNLFSQFGDQHVFVEFKGNLIGTEKFDVDGDGIEDIISGWNKYSGYDIPAKIVWNKGLGDGKFLIEKVIFQSTNPLYCFIYLDTDNDNDFDIIGGDNSSGRIFYVENLGEGNFGTDVTIAILANVSRLFSIDIDDDGLIDLVALGSSGNIVWYQNLGGGNFSSAINLSMLTGSLIGASNVDVDVDGLQDITFARPDLDQVVWYKNLGGGNFDIMQVITQNVDQVEVFKYFDFDGDSDMDIFISGVQTDSIYYQENLGLGIFGVKQFIGEINNPYALDLADLDGDGDLDLINGTGINELVWFENLGSMSFAPYQTITNYSNKIYWLGTGDFDTDGDIDIYSGAYNDKKVSWYQNDGLGNFSQEKCLHFKQDAASNVFAVDFDLDGDLDIMTNTGVNNKKVWYENYAPDQFLTEQVYLETNLSYLKMDFGDIDSDGDVDLVLSMNFDSIVWFENIGNNSMGNYSIISNQVDNVEDLILVDIDNDGDNDIVSASAADSKVAWYENLSNGNFGPQNIILNGAQGPRRIRAGDLDNDGDLDLVLTTWLDDKVSFFENIGGGAFGSQQVIASNMDEAHSIAIEDFNDDGYLDIVASAAWGGTICWYQNLGGLGFGSENILAIGYQNIWDIETGDVDDDGDKDIVWLSYPNSNGGVYWHENLSNGIFTNEIAISTLLVSGQNSDIGDFDNDGDIDVVSISAADKKLAWYENFTYAQNKISGQMFADMNLNFVLDSADIGLPFIGAISNPQSDFTYSNGQGGYSMYFSDVVGTYIVQPQNFNYWSIVTDSLQYTIFLDTAFADIDSLNFGFYPDTILHELSADIVTSMPICNNQSVFWLNIENIGTTIPSGVCSLTLDDSITFISSAIMPDSLVGQTIYWSFDSLSFFAINQIELYVQMPTFLSMGDLLTSIFEVNVFDDTSATSVYTVIDTLDQILLCAYDPNDKISDPVGIDSMGYIAMNTEYIDYTIRFQNTGNYYATNVILKDLLDTNLNWSTLIPLSSSHPVDIFVDQHGEATFSYLNIMLPDSNTNELQSHGYFKYRIYLNDNLPAGTIITNTAHIYFDQNPAVITNTKLNTLFECESLTELMQINSNVLCFEDSLICSNSPILSDLNLSWEISGLDTIVGANLNYQFDSSGVFQVHHILENSMCSVDSVFSVFILPEVNDTELPMIELCEGDSILLFNEYVSNTGIYFDSLQTITGCDSVIKASVIINELPDVFIQSLSEDTVCLDWSAIVLDGIPTGGVFIGPGVVIGSFLPNMAGPGIAEIIYEFSDSNSCQNTDSVIIYVQSCLGEFEDESTKIMVYPTLVTDNFYIVFDNWQDIEYDLVITNSLGQIVFQDKILTDYNTYQRGDIQAGIYYLIIAGKDSQSVATFRLLFVD